MRVPNGCILGQASHRIRKLNTRRSVQRSRTKLNAPPGARLPALDHASGYTPPNSRPHAESKTFSCSQDFPVTGAASEPSAALRD
jgi:hypothetical protein